MDLEKAFFKKSRIQFAPGMVPELPGPDICGVPVRVVGPPPWRDDEPPMGAGACNAGDDEAPETMTEEDISNALDLMETSMRTFDRVLNDWVGPEDEIFRQIRNHRLDLYHVLRKWTDIDERDTKAEQQARDLLRQEVDELIHGIVPLEISKEIKE